MSTYVIGDLHGCKDELIKLLKLIKHNPNIDQLIFVGDLVNRGPKSLEILRYIRSLDKQAIAILGNHDLHLLSVSQGIQKMYPDDTLHDIFTAPDCYELIEWLRHRPLAIFKKNYLICHAGVLPEWDSHKTIKLAHEVEVMLRSKNWIQFLNYTHKNTQVINWRDNLQGNSRLKSIVNILTQIRFCTVNGSLDLQTKKANSIFPNYFPWFKIPGRKTTNTTCIFGHWSTLGLTLYSNLIGLDTGCVWGGKLSAVRLEDRKLFQIAANKTNN